MVDVGLSEVVGGWGLAKGVGTGKGGDRVGFRFGNRLMLARVVATGYVVVAAGYGGCGYG